MTSDSLFVSVTRPCQLWFSDSVEHVECGRKMKRIHDRGAGMNSPGVRTGGWVAKTLPVMTEAHPMPSGRESILLF